MIKGRGAAAWAHEWIAPLTACIHPHHPQDEQQVQEGREGIPNDINRGISLGIFGYVCGVFSVEHVMMSQRYHMLYWQWEDSTLYMAYDLYYVKNDRISLIYRLLLLFWKILDISLVQEEKANIISP